MGESGSSSSATSLAPGFRFHPTDEELVSYYLKRKICGKPFRFDAISDIDIYKAEPWELPGRSKLKSRDLEWYFFSALDKKYGNGARTNRATVEGYWKTTGKDRPVYHRSHVVGMKKTLVYHRGRAPRGARSNWVMHEYRLTDEDLAKARISQDAFVLCRIFQKSGSGPKNGEQYGAPYLEEEWEDDNVVAMVPGQLPAAEGFTADDLLDQSLHVEFPTENAPAALKICQEDTGSNSGNSRSLSGSGQTPLAAAIVGENPCYSGLSDDQKLFNPCMQPELDTNTGKNEYIIDSNNVTNHTSTSYLPVLPRLDIVNNSQAVDNAAYNSQAVDNVPYNSQAVDNAPYNSLAVDNAPYNSLAVDNAPYNTQAVDYEPFDDGLFLEANDLLPPAENDPSYFGDKFDELLAFMDQEDDIEQYFDFDSLGPMANDFTVADDAFLTEENLHNEAERMPQANQQLPGAYADDGGSCSKPAVEVSKSKCELEYPFINRVLGNIPAPPAFAAEFPTKNLAARLNAASDSIHFTAGMVRVRNSISDGNGMQWFMGKDGSMNVVLSFVVPESVVSPIGLDYLSGVLRCKTASAVTRSLFYFFFFWVLVLAISAKIGTCIYAK